MYSTALDFGRVLCLYITHIHSIAPNSVWICLLRVHVSSKRWNRKEIHFEPKIINNTIVEFGFNISSGFFFYINLLLLFISSSVVVRHQLHMTFPQLVIHYNKIVNRKRNSEEFQRKNCCWTNTKTYWVDHWKNIDRPNYGWTQRKRKEKMCRKPCIYAQID